jgi:hypothetical protein
MEQKVSEANSRASQLSLDLDEAKQALARATKELQKMVDQIKVKPQMCVFCLDVFP